MAVIEIDKKITKPTVTLSKAIFNMSKAAVGLGSMLLVSMMQMLGLGYGLITLIFCGCQSALTLHFLSRVTSATRSQSYSGVCREVLGKKGEVISLISLGLVLFGSLMGYTLYIGEYASDGIEYFLEKKISSKLVSSLGLTILVFPISCLKDMSKLGVVSIFGMILMCGITLLLVANYFLAEPIDELIKNHFPVDLLNLEYQVKFTKDLKFFPPLSFAALGCFGSIAFAFTNHFALVSTVNTLENPSRRRISSVIIAATLITALFNILIGVFSLLYYKNTIVNNVLDMPVLRGPWFAIAKISLALSLSFTFPLLLDPLRNVLDKLFKKFIQASIIRHYLETIFIIMTPMLVVFIFDAKVLRLLDVISSLFRVLLVYVLPSLMLLRAPRNIPRMCLKTWERYCAMFILIFGMIICIIGPIFPFLKMINKYPENELLVSFRK